MMKNASNKYVDAVIRDCVLTDLVNAFEKQPKAFLAQLTDNAQATLDQITQQYGVQLPAAEVLSTAIYLVLKKQQGFDLKQLLAEFPNSSASILARMHKDSRKHAALFQAQHPALETAAVSTRSYKR